MDLFVIRHAEAVELGAAGAAADADRPLTDRGRGQALALGRTLKALGRTPAVVVSSPLVRARQTAEGLAEVLGLPAGELVVDDGLSPGLRARKLSRRLRKARAASLAIVGHQPDLGAYLAWVLGSRKARLGLAKAGAALVSCDDDGPAKGAGELVWLVTPEWCGPPE